MKINFTWFKWIGLFITVALLMGAVDPGIFNISSSARPWFFITNITWLLMITSGIFS